MTFGVVVIWYGDVVAKNGNKKPRRGNRNLDAMLGLSAPSDNAASRLA